MVNQRDSITLLVFGMILNYFLKMYSKGGGWA